LDISTIAIILDIKKYILKPIESTPKNVQTYKNNKNNVEKRNYNSFSHLQDYNVQCHKCNNYNHKASECTLPMQSLKKSIPNTKDNKYMERKTCGRKGNRI
jgi:hypothetical protein